MIDEGRERKGVGRPIREDSREAMHTDREEDLIQMPFVTAARATIAQLVSIHLPKFEVPLPNCFRGYDDSALGQKLFHITKTEQEAEKQPDSVANNFRWKAKAFVLGSSRVCFHRAILAHCSVTFPS